jgi:hypothetical protein
MEPLAVIENARHVEGDPGVPPDQGSGLRVDRGMYSQMGRALEELGAE